MIWRTLERYPRATAQALTILGAGILSSLLGFAVAWLLVSGVKTVQAAAAEPVQAADFNCDTVAQANGIEVYYCEPDDGPPFFMNGYGFMTVID